MLHILWLVIKFILIVLGILLGLVLLAVALLLFCPVRYRASAVKEGIEWKLVKANAAVSWLFGGIAAHLQFEQGEMHTSIRILGISMDKFLEKRMKKAAASEASRQPDTESKIGAKKKTSKGAENESRPPLSGDIEISHEMQNRSETIEPDAEPQNPSQTIEPHSESEEPVRTDILLLSEDETSDEGAEHNSRPKRSIGELIRSILEKLRQILIAPFRLLRALAAIPGRIVQKIRNIALTFRGIYAKIDWWKQFVNHPRTQEAISLVWNHAKGLVKHVLPTKIEGKVTFGSEDPAVTGTVLAILGMSFPLHKNRIAVNPLFDGENVLEGEIRLKGRIYGWVLLKAAVTIYFNKNVKYVINRWKHKEG